MTTPDDASRAYELHCRETGQPIDEVERLAWMREWEELDHQDDAELRVRDLAYHTEGIAGWGPTMITCPYCDHRDIDEAFIVSLADEAICPQCGEDFLIEDEVDADDEYEDD